MMSQRRTLSRALNCSALVVPMLAACSSISSTPTGPDTAIGEGVLYYLPERPIVVELTMPTEIGKRAWPVIKEIPPAPDYDRRFTLRYERNLFGKNHMRIGVSPVGLLTSADADVTSGIPDIVKSLGKFAGQITGTAGGQNVRGEADVPKPTNCRPGLVYAVAIDVRKPDERTKTLCDQYTVRVLAMNGNDIKDPSPTAPKIDYSADNGKHASGYFYRQDRPYRVLITDMQTNTETTLFATSPNLSPTAFIRTPRSFFSDSKSNVMFKDGALQSVEASVDGEVTAAVALPSDFIEAYMKALGGIFTSFGDQTKSQQAIQDNQRALNLAAIQRQICQGAIDTNRPALTADTSNMSQSDRTAAASTAAAAAQAIKSSCTQ